MNPENVSARLKSETANAHQLAEDLLMPKLQGLRTLQDYVAVLRMFYGYYRPLQAEVEKLIPFSVLADVKERNPAKWIEADFSHLGIDPQTATLTTALPSLLTPPAAMGALYVMEGSTLGGRYIYKMLQGHPSMEVPAAALHFFNGYGEATSQRWKSFGAALNSLPLHQDEIVRSAEETFRLFAQWIRQTLYHE